MPVQLLAVVMAVLGILVGILGSAGAAGAADLYGDRDPRLDPRLGAYSPYDDPRYADVYRHPDRRHAEEERYYSERPPQPDYREGYAAPPLVQHDPGLAPDPRYAAPLPGLAAPWQPCMSRPEIRRHAREQGWRVLRWHDITRTTATFEAERLGDGRLFEVSVDRCTSKLLALNPSQRGYGDYAWRRRVYDRAY